ncbi:lytic transglycosylase [Serratia phage vB_SmaM_Hera]|uniref:Lytic transglycosylase n=2 Tax=Myosmarvirus MTx TaxID=2846180 RepID=A0A482MG06_9CAUD|nr:lytic tail protein [Serratia phage MTx]QBQ72355.1 lytic transglycosylase [Serratia phage MTx]QPX74717.1 lytic transglycosylase [Serratia phage vB_SmaM_Hera]
MSDSAEQFTMQYQIDLKDSIDRLERLHDKIRNVNKEANKSSKNLKGAGDGIKNAFKALSPLAPELAGATAGAVALTGGLMGVASALAIVAVGVKAIISLRKEYDVQRQLSFDSGLNVRQIEQFQRQAVGGSRLNSEQARGIISKTSNLAYSAYTNPDPMSRETLMLRQMGAMPFTSSGRLKDTMTILDEISKKFQTMTKEQSYALGQSAGFTHDEVDALRNRTDAMKRSTQMTKEDQALQDRAARSMDDLNEHYNKMVDRLRIASNVIGANFVPMLTRFIDWIVDVSEKVPKLFTDVFDELRAQFQASMNTFWDVGSGSQDRYAKELEKQRAAIKEDNEKRARNTDNAAAQARELQAKFARDVNLFSSSVSAFAGVIDERQAIAAWAGEVGRAGGIGSQVGTASLGSGATMGTPVRGTSVAPAQYASIIKEAAAKYNLPEDILAKQIQVESGYNPNAVSEAGAVGLGQIMPSNFKSLGISNPYDPRQSINGMAQLMREYMNYTGGDIRESLTMYHGGYKKSGWGPRTLAYADKVLNANVNYGGANAERPVGAPQLPVASLGDADYSRTAALGGHYAPVAGESRAKTQEFQVRDAIAKALGVPTAQLNTGGVSQGDIHFTRAKLETNLMRDIQRNQLAVNAPGILPRQQAEAQQRLRASLMQFDAMKRYGRQIEDTGRMGGRDITLQEKAIFIEINGAQSPEDTGREVQRQLYSSDLSDIINGSASAVKY